MPPDNFLDYREALFFVASIFSSSLFSLRSNSVSICRRGILWVLSCPLQGDRRCGTPTSPARSSRIPAAFLHSEAVCGSAPRGIFQCRPHGGNVLQVRGIPLPRHRQHHAHQPRVLHRHRPTNACGLRVLVVGNGATILRRQMFFIVLLHIGNICEILHLYFQYCAKRLLTLYKLKLYTHEF